MINNIVAFIVVLGILVFFHEFGHFLFAKLFGVGVEKFSLGFGPRLFGKQYKQTDYRVSAIPLGGYVKMVGEDPEDDIDAADIPLSFTHKPLWQRTLIVAAGPVFNFLLAVIIFSAIFYTFGLAVTKASVGEVTETGPAQKAGIKQNDLIVAVGDKKILTWNDMAENIRASKGKSLKISVSRNGEILNFDIIPEKREIENIFGEKKKEYVIGIIAGNDFLKKDLNPIEALQYGTRRSFEVVNLIGTSIVKMVSGRLSAKEMEIGGPIMIAQMAGEQAKKGIVSLLFFTALLSINLAVLNLLPIPVLDGGHLFMFLIEAVIRRPVNINIKRRAQQIGFSLLMALMVYVVYSDIVKLFK
ncbi:MAG: RIP metalloprotease RseP [Deltaproteobacteria bacterium]|nr:RIP metalloprotease RseP [Deltaproteobacteria bacterium]